MTAAIDEDGTFLVLESTVTDAGGETGSEGGGLDITSEGSIGGIRIGSTEDDVSTLATTAGLGDPSKGPEQMSDAIGVAFQTWSYPKSGLSIEMASEQIGGAKTVFSITMESPSALATESGIKIGSLKAEAIKSYTGFQTDREGVEGFFSGQDVHLVGSIYGGMIITFEKGKVAKVFLGPSAE